MKSLVGLLLVISGTILAIPPLYEVLSYLEYKQWPIVQSILGVLCIGVGLLFLVWQRSKTQKGIIEVG